MTGASAGIDMMSSPAVVAGGDPILGISSVAALYYADDGVREVGVSSGAKNFMAWSEWHAVGGIGSGMPWEQGGCTASWNYGLDPGEEFATSTLVTPTGGVGSSLLGFTLDSTPSIDRTFSIYVKQGPSHNGTSKFQIWIQQWVGLEGAPSTVLTAQQNFTPTTEWARYQLTAGSNYDGPRPRIKIYPDVDTGTETIEIAWRQWEESSTATSYESTGPALNQKSVPLVLDQSGNGRHLEFLYGADPVTLSLGAFGTEPGIHSVAVSSTRLAVLNAAKTTYECWDESGGFSYFYLLKVVGAGTNGLGSWQRNNRWGVISGLTSESVWDGSNFTAVAWNDVTDSTPLFRTVVVTPSTVNLYTNNVLDNSVSLSYAGRATGDTAKIYAQAGAERDLGMLGHVSRPLTTEERAIIYNAAKVRFPNAGLP